MSQDETAWGPSCIASRALLEVLNICEARGLSVRRIALGDLHLDLAQPWPAPEPRAPKQDPDEQALFVEQEALAKYTPETRAKLKKLRASSKKTFGRILDDEALLKMEGVL